MTTLYFDAFSGASGDMILGALSDLGFDIAELGAAAEALHLSRDAISVEQVERGALSCRKVNIRTASEHPHHRHLDDLIAIVDALPYSKNVRERSVKVLHRLAEAEAKIHGIAVSEVHFHEVGAADSLLDVVGACLGIERLGVGRITCSALPTGGGTVESMHGTLPLPAPATLELLAGAPVYPARREGEHVTPTAAALFSVLAESFGDLPAGVIRKVGYGAGSRTYETGLPNALRAVLLDEAAAGHEAGESLVIEANIDDMNPQLYPGLIERVMEAGGLDVALHPCVMKKGRPGILVRIIAKPDALDAVSRVLFEESTTIGLRYWPVARTVGERTYEMVETEFGPIAIKVTRHLGRIVNVSPEFRDCESAAKKHGIPVKHVIQAALAARKCES